MNITLQSDFVLPAEWQPQDGVMLTWPHEHTDWKPYLDDITKTYIELTRIIAGHETVIITTPTCSRCAGNWLKACGLMNSAACASIR